MTFSPWTTTRGALESASPRDLAYLSATILGVIAVDSEIYIALSRAAHNVSQLTCCSKAWAARKRVASSKCRPTSINPTGSPLDLPQGMLRAG